MAFTTFISAEELAQHMGHPNWVVIDCRFNLDDPQAGKLHYLNAHIPGAIYADLDRELSSLPGTKTGRHPLPDLVQLAASFSRMGIDADTQVVAYDLPFAARLWWLLRLLGHTSVAVLDGGFNGWVSNGLKSRSGEELRTRAEFNALVQDHMIMDIPEILAAIQGESDVLLIDSRSPERYRGEQEPRDPVAARIPGAVNRFWEKNLDSNGFLRPVEEITAEFQHVIGTHLPSQAAVYCGSGVTAAVNSLVLQHAGLENVRLYPGSWSQWCSDPSRPIERG